MFQFLYKPEEEVVTGRRMIFAVVALMAVLAGAVMLVKPGINEAKNIFQKMQKNPRLIVIKADNCADCFEITQVTDFVKGALGIDYKSVKELKASDVDAGVLIKMHKIEFLPTFILQGNIKALDLGKVLDESSTLVKTDKLFVYKNRYPPFVNVATGDVEGRFGVVYLTDKACKTCYDVHLHDIALSNLIMVPSTTSSYDVASPEGRKMVSDYKINYAPTIILKGDLAAYQNFPSLWTTVGSVEKDGTYVFREKGLDIMGTYRNIWNGRLVTPKPQQQPQVEVRTTPPPAE
jgi:hypothetical protein